MIYNYISCFRHVFFSPACAVMSENYIVFIEQPIKLDLLKFMLYRIQGKSFHKIMTWDPHSDTIFHLVNRHTGKVGSVYCTAADSLHTECEVGNTHPFAEQSERKGKLQANLFTHGEAFSLFILMKSHSDGVAFSHTLLLSIFSSHYTAHPLSI